MVSRLRGHRIVLWVLAALLLAYALAGFFVVPRVARSQIEAFVVETLHRRITIGEVEFNPFTLAATITELRLTEADGSPLIAFQRLYVNVELASIWRRGVVFKEIDLAGPDVELIVAGDGSVNLAALAPPAAPAATAKPAGEKPLRVEIGRFAVSGGRVGFQDRSQAPPFAAAFTPIRFSLTDFSTEVGHSNAYSFTTASRLGAKFEWSGAFTVQPLGSSGTFGVSDLRLAALDDYLEAQMPAEIISGSVELRGSYRFELQPLALHVVLPSIGVRDLVLAERGVAAAPLVTVPQIDVQDVVFSLSRRDVNVRRVDVRGARIEVVREKDGSLNLARLAPASAAPALPPPVSSAAAKPQAPWTVRAETIAIEGATVAAEDRSTSPPARMRLTPIAITVNSLSTAPAARMKLDTQVGIDGQGQLAVRGDFGLDPVSAALTIDLQKFPLSALQPYLTQSTGLTLHSGSLGIKGNVALPAARRGAPPAVKVSADVRIDDLRAADNTAAADEDLVKWRSLAITGIRFQQRPDRLAIERIAAHEPYVRFVIAENGTTTLARALARPEGKTPAADEPPIAKAPPATAQSGTGAQRMQIAIQSVQVTDGSANFADFSVQPSFATGILGLGGEITGLSSAAESRAKVALSGKVDQYSPVEISGELNLLSADVYTRLGVSFSNIELTSFNPYSGKFAGYNISRGKLSTAMKYHVENRKLDAQHHIVVDNLEFGEQTHSKDAAPIPIKLGIALLKDRRGVIEVDLPISGTLDQPEFHIGAIIWNGIVNLLTKLITAPFKALGGGTSEDLQFVDFQPGSAALGEAQAKKLGTLSKGLVERPELRLNVPLAVKPAEDADAMAKQALLALVPPVDPAKLGAALDAAYRTQFKTAPEYPKEMLGDEAPKLEARMAWLEAALLERLQPAPAALEALGKQRAGAVRDALLANKELKPERVFIVTNHAEPAPLAGTVRMEMKLE